MFFKIIKLFVRLLNDCFTIHPEMTLLFLSIFTRFCVSLFQKARHGSSSYKEILIKSKEKNNKINNPYTNLSF